jgi:L-serine/L-threonine ammonia-lyase
VEPACGASLAVVYDSAPELEDFNSVLVVVCGGVTTTIEQLLDWSNQYD